MPRKTKLATASAVQSPVAKTPKKPQQPGGDDPLGVLLYEHRTLQNLFAQFAGRKEKPLAQRVGRALNLHFQVETALYDEADAIPELHAALEAAMRERHNCDELIKAIGPLEEGDELNEHMLDLQAAVDRLLRDEEKLIFPSVARHLSRSHLGDLGVSLRAARDKLQ